LKIMCVPPWRKKCNRRTYRLLEELRIAATNWAVPRVRTA
jgi:hypothetical protein